MTKFLLILVVFLSVRSFGQTKNYSEKDVYRLFQKTISQQNKKNINIPSNPWLFCNKDSTFYLNDTLQLISNSYHNHKLVNCCDYIGWAFYQKDKFVSTRLRLCNEPTTASLTKDSDYFVVKVFSADNYLTLSLFNNNKIVDRFKIVDISSVKQGDTDLNSTIITLLRLK